MGAEWAVGSRQQAASTHSSAAMRWQLCMRGICQHAQDTPGVACAFRTRRVSAATGCRSRAPGGVALHGATEARPFVAMDGRSQAKPHPRASARRRRPWLTKYTKAAMSEAKGRCEANHSVWLHESVRGECTA